MCGGEALEWYYWILTYMMIGGAFGIAVIGDQLGLWFLVGCIASIAIGFVTIKFRLLPHDENKW